jgi:hypothetical protein
MLVASLILGKTAISDKSLVLPLIVAMIGIITVVIGSSGLPPGRLQWHDRD